MSSYIFRVLDMVLRVLGFVHAHPSDDPVHIAAAARLEEGVARLKALLDQERNGVVTEGAATITKQQRRGELEDRFALIARIAASARQEHPTLAVRLTMPKARSGQQTFLTSGSVILKEARAQQEALLEYGLTPAYLDQTEALLEQYREAIETKIAGTSSHVGANAELEALATELRRIVRLLDTFNRPRFRHDAEKRAVWKSVRTLVRHAPKPDAGSDSPAA